MQTRSLLLQILQSLHALTGNLQGFLQRAGIGDRHRRARCHRRLRCGLGNWGCGRSYNGCRLLRNRWTLFGAFEIVSAGQRNRHAGLFALLRLDAFSVAFIPVRQCNRVTQRAHLSQGTGQVVDARTLAIGGIDSNRLVCSLTKDRVDHTGQTRTRANLEEGAHAGCVHGFNFCDKVDRTRQLNSEDIASFLSLLRVNTSGGVGKDTGRRFSKLDLLQTFAKGTAGISDQLTVEGRSNRKLLIT